MKKYVVFFAGLILGLSLRAQPILQNVYARETMTLDGLWNYIVDPLDNGYYDYRLQPMNNGFSGTPKR